MDTNSSGHSTRTSRYARLVSELLESAGHTDSAKSAREGQGKRGPCPFCGSGEGLAVDDLEGMWRCHACHAGGGVRDLVIELGLDWPAFAEDHGLKGHAEDEGKRPRATQKHLKAAWATAVASPVPAQARAYARFRHFPEAFELGLARALLAGDADRLPRSCSHLAGGDRIVVPLYRVASSSAGTLVGLQARTTDFNREPRVVGAGRTGAAVFADAPALQALRGEEGAPAVVLLVEGLTDFLCAATVSLASVGVMGIAGTGNAEAAIGAWARGRRVIIAFDGDEAGQEAATAAAGRVHLWGGEPLVTVVTPDSDICSLVRAGGREEIGRLLADARPADREVEQYLQDEERWPEPVPYTVRQLAPFPVDALPPVLRRFARSAATRLKVDPALPAWVALVGISMACRDRLILKITPTWWERSNVYVVIVALPGSRKSPAINPLVAFYLNIERNLLSAYEGEIRQPLSRRDILKEKIKRLKREASKADEPEECATAEDEVLKAEAELGAIQIPPPPRLITNNASSAKLARLLARHGVVGCLSADAHPFEIAAGRWSADGSDDCDAWIAGWSGDSLIVDRTPKNGDHSDGEHIVHPHPRLVALVGAQPAVLAKIGRKDHLRGIGFVARFIFGFPEDLAGKRPRGLQTDEDDTWPAVERLLSRLIDTLGADTTVEMTHEALELFESYEARTDQMGAEGGPFENARDFASKFPSQLARIILILHAAECDGKATFSEPVTLDTVTRAIQIMEFVESHALGALDEIRGRGDLEYIIRRIHELGTPEFTRRDLHRATQKRFPDAKGLDEPLRMLIDRGYLLVADEEQRSGRPTALYRINARAIDLIRQAADTGTHQAGQDAGVKS